MTTSPDRVRALIDQSWDMPYGAAQIALTEEAIAQADAMGDDDLRFDARMAATNAYQHGGEPAKGFVTFSWCLAHYDRDPARFGHHEHLLLWYFKYMVHSLTRFPEVPLERTYAVLDDMQRRFAQGGHSLQTVHKHRWLVAMHIGDMEAAERHYDAWQSAPRDSNSDCQGCDPTDQVWHLAQQGRYEEAIALTGPVLAGRLTCAEQPQSILTQLLIPYLRTGRLDEARAAHHTAYRAIRRSVANLSDLADHLYFLAVCGNESYARELMERHLSWLDRPATPYGEMWFSAAAALVLSRLGEARHAEFAERALALAKRFDARNGTGHQSEQVRACLAAQPIVAKLPMSLTAQLARPAQAPAAPAPKERPKATLDDVPAGAGLDELLDLAEDALWRDDSARVEALWARVTELTGGDDLTALQRGRVADLAGMRMYDGDSRELVEKWHEAVRWYEAAGDTIRRARTRGRIGLHRCRHGEPDQGLEQVRETTDFLLAHGSPRDHAGALRRLAVALLHVGAPAEAIETLDKLDGVPEPDPGPRVRLQATMIRAQALGADGRLDEALIAGQSLVDGGRAAGEGELVALGEFILGQAHLLREDSDAAVAAYERALRHADLPFELVREVRERLGMLLAGTGRSAEAVDDLASLVARLVTEGQEAEADYARFQLAVALFNADRANDAAEVAEEALYGAERAGSQGLADQVRHLLSAIYQRLDDPGQALAHLDQLAANLNGFDHAQARASVLEQAGDLLYEQDRDGQAAQRFEAAAAAYDVAGLPVDRLRMLRRQAVAAMFGFGADTAREVLAAADRHAATLPTHEPDSQYELAWLALDGARVLAGAGDAESALERVRPVPEAFRSLGSFGEAFLAELTMGEVLLTLGRPDAAERVLRGVVGGLPRDAGALPRAAYALAHALAQQDKMEEARKLAGEYGFDLE
ncbi:tetratricopeptide repeat protein [Allorhizocola rhizosphaerae]|uniref:tetratricopeptide repeat protein n=1 Tax=Allorhizocola rhizosphaerae TaxID=1872709 RepID=UPI000E3EC813|nr:hypothetical protein [Allorhizocola rhizosphaerae]